MKVCLVAAVVAAIFLLVTAAFCLAMPKTPPSLGSDKIDELELHGVDSVRALLASPALGFPVAGAMGLFAPNPTTGVHLGKVVVNRGEIQEWLKWRAAKDAYWIEVGVVAAVLAAVFSLGALLK